MNEANMHPKLDRFIRRQNVERYDRLLERVTEKSDRQKILNLLAEERQKQKDADDPLW
jgi:hypothetical protein